MDCSPPGSSVHGDSPGKNTGVDCHVLLQGIFPTQGSNPGLLHCRQILYSLSHQGSPWILEWVASPFSRGSSWPRNRTRVSCIAGGFFTSWATREARQHLPNIKWASIICQPQGKACGMQWRVKGAKASSFHPNQEVTCETTKDVLGYVITVVAGAVTGKSRVLLQEHIMDGGEQICWGPRGGSEGWWGPWWQVRLDSVGEGRVCRRKGDCWRLPRDTSQQVSECT